MRFVSNDDLESRAGRLLRDWMEAEEVSCLAFPIDVSRLATDFLGIEVKFGVLDSKTIAEFRVIEEVFVLDHRHNKNPFRARFSIAHEIGHLNLHSSLGSVFCRDSDQSRFELQANRFAAALLMPATDLVELVAEETSALGAFSRNVAEADISAACKWLKHLLGRGSLQDSSLNLIATRFGVSMQSLNVRLKQLHIIA
jgi:Zn-dependent peptidase ImmA (M78 family)